MVDEAVIRSCAHTAVACQPTGVFSRLDRGVDEGIRTTAGKAAAAAGNINTDDLDDSDDDGSILQYAGVLKRPPTSQKKAVALRAATKAAPTTLRRLGGKFKLPPDSPTSSSAAANGLPPAKLSILRRLGKLPATHQGKATVPPKADTQDNKVTTSTRPRAQARLSVASPKVSSSTGATAGGDSAGAQMDMRAISVFKRLGSKKP